MRHKGSGLLDTEQIEIPQETELVWRSSVCDVTESPPTNAHNLQIFPLTSNGISQVAPNLRQRPQCCGHRNCICQDGGGTSTHWQLPFETRLISWRAPSCYFWENLAPAAVNCDVEMKGRGVRKTAIMWTLGEWRASYHCPALNLPVTARSEVANFPVTALCIMQYFFPPSSVPA